MDGNWLMGEVTIPDDKKKEFNDYVLELMKVAGLRQIRRVKLRGRDFCAVEYPRVDKYGMVYFNYSIFEKKEYDQCCYNMNACRLYCDNKGEGAFATAVNMIWVMQMAYSDTPCFVMCDGKPWTLMRGIPAFIKAFIGVDLDWSKQLNGWERRLVFRKYGFDGIDEMDYMLSFPKRERNVMKYYYSSIIYEDSEIRHASEYPEDDFWPIENGKIYWTGECIYNIMEVLLERDGYDEVRSRMKELFSHNKEERREMMKCEDKYWARMAELSLYQLPVTFVRALAMHTHGVFMALWDEYFEDSYMDIIIPDDAMEYLDIEPFESAFETAFGVEDDVARIEFWSYSDAKDAERVSQWINEWRDMYSKITEQDVEDLNMEDSMIRVLRELYGKWDSCYMLKRMVEEFCRHGDDSTYKRAILVYEELIDEPFEWTVLQSFGMMLSNEALRKEVLGF